eukprot:EC799888.1.p1 GENE.EC799888.1~~EC799888.1.p1  ORF type:complete len:80 (+),score=3.53 EC799888.1:476-715(+)
MRSTTKSLPSNKFRASLVPTAAAGRRSLRDDYHKARVGCRGAAADDLRWPVSVKLYMIFRILVRACVLEKLLLLFRVLW